MLVDVCPSRTRFILLRRAASDESSRGTLRTTTEYKFLKHENYSNNTSLCLGAGCHGCCLDATSTRGTSAPLAPRTSTFASIRRESRQLLYQVRYFYESFILFYNMRLSCAFGVLWGSDYMDFCLGSRIG